MGIFSLVQQKYHFFTQKFVEIIIIIINNNMNIFRPFNMGDYYIIIISKQEQILRKKKPPRVFDNKTFNKYFFIYLD